jgi:antiviral helicase SKI2
MKNDLKIENEVDMILNELFLNDNNFNISKNKKSSNIKKEYAIMKSTDVTNFSKLVPVMAMQFGFDLDVFQKEAIYHLENNENVFVSAHTSSGLFLNKI